MIIAGIELCPSTRYTPVS